MSAGFATTSTQFTGMKQSRIICPILFRVYMGDISLALISSGMGGGGGLRGVFFKSLRLC